MNKIQKITLDNGLRIILAPQPQNLATTVLVLVEAGSKYETKEISGLSHFLEHMCFKGTKKRPRIIDITSELDSIGSDYNAFTSLEYTGYYAKAQSKHFNKILDVISDVYLNPIFEPTEIEKEKGVIIEEINYIEDVPIRKIWDNFLDLLYGDQPAGWDIAGTKEVVQKLTKEDFLKYRKEHYIAKGTLVVVSGNFDEKKVIKQIQDAFNGIISEKKFGKVKTKESQDKPKVLLKFKQTDQTHLILGVRAFDIFDERRYALQVLSDILGGGMSSRLFQKVREEMAAAYYVRSEADLYTDHGYLAASAGVDNSKINEVIEAILKEFKSLTEKLVEDKELQRAKDHLTGNLILGLETSDSIASFYGGQEILTKKTITPEELIKKVQAVKSEEIMAVAKEIFQNNKLNLAIIGPLKDKERFESILKI